MAFYCSSKHPLMSIVFMYISPLEHSCKDFTCNSNGFCIHPDLLCDGINHCSDNSDESVHNLCQSGFNEMFMIIQIFHYSDYIKFASIVIEFCLIVSKLSRRRQQCDIWCGCDLVCANSRWLSAYPERHHCWHLDLCLS